MRAKAFKTIKSAKRTSCQQYVSKLNSRNPAKKIWDMIRKIKDKNKTNKHVHIKSKTKTHWVHFCQIRHLHLDPHLTIYGSPIPVVSEAKFLSLLFDNKLSFIPHIKALKAKRLKALDILKVLSSSDLGGDRTVLLNLYTSFIRSKLDYGSIVYGSARKSYLKSLDTIHYQGLRLALGAFCTSPVESLYA